MPKEKPKSKRRVLKGWGEIAEFLGQTVSVAQRWQKEGMPVTREGRSSCLFRGSDRMGRRGTRQEGTCSHCREGEDLLADLKQGLSRVRQQRKNLKS